MRIFILASFWLPFGWNVFFHPFTFSLYVSLGLKWVSCRQHIYESCFWIHSTSLCLLVRVCNPFIFNVIVYIYIHTHTHTLTHTHTHTHIYIYIYIYIYNGNPLQYSCLENPMDRGAWQVAIHGVAESWIQLSDFTFTFHFHALEKGMATHSSVLAWWIPGTTEPGGLPSMGSYTLGHNWSNLAVVAAASISIYISISISISICIGIFLIILVLFFRSFPSLVPFTFLAKLICWY